MRDNIFSVGMGAITTVSGVLLSRIGESGKHKEAQEKYNLLNEKLNSVKSEVLKTREQLNSLEDKITNLSLQSNPESKESEIITQVYKNEDKFNKECLNLQEEINSVFNDPNKLTNNFLIVVDKYLTNLVKLLSGSVSKILMFW